MKIKIKLMTFLTVVTIAHLNFAAGLIITSEFPTTVTVFLDNGTVKSKYIEASDNGNFRLIKSRFLAAPVVEENENKFFMINAGLGGFSKVEWIDNRIEGNNTYNNRYVYNEPISGLNGWIAYHIIKNSATPASKRID